MVNITNDKNKILCDIKQKAIDILNMHGYLGARIVIDVSTTVESATVTIERQEKIGGKVVITKEPLT